MLIFIIPLRSRAVSRDWQRVSALCARTIISCCHQREGEYHTILVCNEAPSLPHGLKNLTIIEEPFRIPNDSQAQMIDKYRKIQRGLVHARRMAPFFWMKVDSDDCVSNRLAGVVASQLQSPGWLFGQGWVQKEGSRSAYLFKQGFFKVCGTSSILACRKPEELPSNMDQSLSQFAALSTSHAELDKLVMDRGEPLRVLPFPGAIYCAGTGENHSGFQGVSDFKSKKWIMRRLLHTRLVTRRMRDEFGLTKLPDFCRD